MQATIQAVLARFKGNKTQAIYYCAEVAEQYPHLRTEYMQILWTLIS